MTDLSYVSNCLTKHGIPYTTITKANAGFINDVYLADTCVVKIFKENNGSITRERFIYDTLKPDYAPSLLAQGENYLILQRIKGDSIFHLWPDMNNAQREETVKKIRSSVFGSDTIL